MGSTGCPGADSNRDAFRHYPLKIACLPVSPPGRAAQQDSRSRVGSQRVAGLRIEGAPGDRNTVQSDRDRGAPEAEERLRVGTVAMIGGGRGGLAVQLDLYIVPAAAQQIALGIPGRDDSRDPR